jgi:hypothetical protein
MSSLKRNAAITLISSARLGPSAPRSKAPECLPFRTAFYRVPSPSSLMPSLRHHPPEVSFLMLVALLFGVQHYRERKSVTASFHSFKNCFKADSCGISCHRACASTQQVPLISLSQDIRVLLLFLRDIWSVTYRNNQPHCSLDAEAIFFAAHIMYDYSSYTIRKTLQLYWTYSR